MATKIRVLAGLIAIGLLALTSLPDAAWARRDTRQDECPPETRCIYGAVTPDSDHGGDDRETSDDSDQDDDTSQDDDQDNAPSDTAPE